MTIRLTFERKPTKIRQFDGLKYIYFIEVSTYIYKQMKAEYAY